METIKSLFTLTYWLSGWIFGTLSVALVGAGILVLLAGVVNYFN
jgi:hypothetical protein